MKRRKFLKQITNTTLLTGIGQFPLQAFSKDDLVQLTILHTNDVHSRINPFPMDGSRNQGLGGAARRATLIKQIKREVEHTLLLDLSLIHISEPTRPY